MATLSIDFGFTYPDRADLVNWVYEIAQYLQNNPIVTPENVGAMIGAWLATHPIPQDVTSVNGKRGDVRLTFDDVGALPILDGAGAHNSTYRGKSLGGVVTQEHFNVIKNNTFTDLYVGDYWSIGGVDYAILGFNLHIGSGDIECKTPHVNVAPLKSMYSAQMNDTRTTAGGYVGSKMYSEGLTQAKDTIFAAFGEDHILTHRQYLCNAVSDGVPSGASWYDSTVELMNERDVYGARVFGTVPDGSIVPAPYTIDKCQFPLFRFRPDLISNRQTFWLRDTVLDQRFSSVSYTGGAGLTNASDSIGVRPAFSIIG